MRFSHDFIIRLSPLKKLIHNYKSSDLSGITNDFLISKEILQKHENQSAAVIGICVIQPNL